jgi:hypothetical protein
MNSLGTIASSPVAGPFNRTLTVYISQKGQNSDIPTLDMILMSESVTYLNRIAGVGPVSVRGVAGLGPRKSDGGSLGGAQASV